MGNNKELIKKRNGLQASLPTEALKEVANFRISLPTEVLKDLANIQNSLPTEVLKDLANIQNSLPTGVLKDLANFRISLPTEVLKDLANIQNSLPTEVLKDLANFRISLPSEALEKLASFQTSILTETLRELASIWEPNIYPIKPLGMPFVPIFEHEIEKSKREIEREAIIAYSEDEFKFNIRAYKFLCDLEVCLRDLIQKRIIESCKHNLNSKIPEGILKKWEEKRNDDPLKRDKDRLIDYSDFSDLKMIFEKKSNKTVFKDIFNDQQYAALISKLHELNPIRIKIAHFRSLTEIEITRLALYHHDIMTIVQK